MCWLSRLPGQLSLAAGVFAVIPFHELAILHHVLGDDGDSVLTVVVEGDLADDESRSFTLLSASITFLRSGSTLLDTVDDHIHRGIGKRAIGFRRIVVFLRVVFFHEELAAR